MSEPNREQRSASTLDIDSFLETHDVCNLGCSANDNARDGEFGQGSRMFATLAKDPKRSETRTIYFEQGGRALVVETKAAFDCAPGLTLGRDDIGGTAVSSAHAQINIQDSRYHLTDLDSTNGTSVYKAREFQPAKEEYRNKMLYINIDEALINVTVGIGDRSGIKISKNPNGGFYVTDIAKNKAAHAQYIYPLNEGESLIIGGKTYQHDPETTEKCLTIPDDEVLARHLRIMIKDGAIYIANLIGQEFSVVVEKVQQKQTQGTADQAKPKVKQKPPDQTVPTTVNSPSRISTAKLWRDMEKEAEAFRAEGLDENKIYKRLAKNYHPDLHLDDKDNADRRMQIINKLFGR